MGNGGWTMETLSIHQPLTINHQPLTISLAVH
jgi:hypothetical protein